MRAVCRHRSARLAWLLALGMLGCGGTLELGSDLLWTARFETGAFDEWAAVGGGVFTEPASSLVEPSASRVHAGAFAAKMTIDAPPGGEQATATLIREGGLPDEAFYSAWYYLPQSVEVADYLVLMKLRARADAADPASDHELYDIDLKTLPTGEMAIRVYDHAQLGDAPMTVPDPVVPVGGWFHLEAYYRNAGDTTGRLVLWLDGEAVADVAKPTGTPGWVGWQVGSVGQNMEPATVTLYVDDCAVSRSRVGPTGLLSW